MFQIRLSLHSHTIHLYLILFLKGNRMDILMLIMTHTVIDGIKVPLNINLIRTKRYPGMIYIPLTDETIIEITYTF